MHYSLERCVFSMPITICFVKKDNNKYKINYKLYVNLSIFYILYLLIFDYALIFGTQQT